MHYWKKCIYACFLVSITFLFTGYETKPSLLLFPTALPGLDFYSENKYIPFTDPVITSDSSSAIIHFRRAGNLILINATADTTDGFFILDTGAPYLVLNITYFRDYPSGSPSDGVQGGITGEVSSFAPTKVNKLSLGPFHYHQLEADRINLGHIEDSKGVKILGLLGMQLFKQFEMIIDYEANVIYLHLISKKETRTYKSSMLQDTSRYSVFPIIIREDKLMIKATIGGKTLTFIIDTGAESNIIDSRLPNAIFDLITINRRVLLAGNGGAKVEALYGDMGGLKIGDIAISALPVLVTNLEKMCSAYNTNCLDGMLGFDFLSMHKIGFNFVTRKMYIWK